MALSQTSFVRPPVCSIGNFGKNFHPATSAIEGTVLGKNASPDTIRDLCQAALFYHWKGVCVYPKHIGVVSRLLKGSGITPVSVVGFPDGNTPTEQKIADVLKAVSNGAREVDMVVGTNALKSRKDDTVKNDIERVAAVAHAHGAALKVILEAGVLTDEEISRGAKLAIEAGADFLKRSTGFEPDQNKIKDDAVRYHQLDLMAQAIAESGWKKSSRINAAVQMKDSGQIHTLETALGSLGHSASRLGIGFESALKISEEETGNRWNSSKTTTKAA